VSVRLTGEFGVEGVGDSVEGGEAGGDAAF
jgi:hypothetical protein